MSGCRRGGGSTGSASAFRDIPSGSEFFHLLHYALRRIDVVGRQDQLHQFVEFTVYPRKLVLHRSQTSSTLHPQPVDLAGKLATEFLE
jgi:hypothetical protein